MHNVLTVTYLLFEDMVQYAEKILAGRFGLVVWFQTPWGTCHQQELLDL